MTTILDVKFSSNDFSVECDADEGDGPIALVRFPDEDAESVRLDVQKEMFVDPLPVDPPTGDRKRFAEILADCGREVQSKKNETCGALTQR